MKKLFITLYALLATYICVAFYFLNVPLVQAEKGVVFELKQGMGKRTLLAELTQQHILSNTLFYGFYVYPQTSAKLKAGEYLFPKGANFLSIWEQLTKGHGQLFHAFTIIPGWTFAQVRESLNKADWVQHQTKDLTDKQIMTQLGFPNLPAEGEFYPETYYYTRGVSDSFVLKRAFQLMQNKLAAAWQKRSLNLPYQNAYQALIAASLIEKEAYLSSERPIIAGVLVNRLKKDMLLQFDPTIIYGLGAHYDKKIRKEDILADTPYNTYVHKGLPPTPIAIPSFASIDAALNPTQHDYYYFVATGNNGAHQFSKTLIEHNAAVKAAIKPQAFFNTPKLGQELIRIMKGMNAVLITV